MTDAASAAPARAIAELLLELARRVEARANSSPLKPAQWSALRYLSTAPASARTNRAFATYHHTTTGTVTLTLKALTEKGLLSRQPDPKDGRVVRFDVTDAGHAMLKDDPLRMLVASVAGLPAAQRTQLIDILTELLLEEPAG